VSADWDRAALSAHVLDLFLESLFIDTETTETEGIAQGTTELVLDGAFQGLVTDAKFTNTGFDCHDRTSMSCWPLK